MVQRWLTESQGIASFGPNLCLNTTATHSSRCLAVYKEEHLGAALLRRRATGSSDCGDRYTFATLVSLGHHSIKVHLCNCAHVVQSIRRSPISHETSRTRLGRVA